MLSKSKFSIKELTLKCGEKYKQANIITIEGEYLLFKVKKMRIMAMVPLASIASFRENEEHTQPDLINELRNGLNNC